ncbi:MULTISPECIES: hypothetical protein [unclassified Variovorax]|uniref:hypothetical protein n=1 Tax=unclassified Variovorax TaxID=663243 RepID=UPI000B095E97|nr:MULTISPECIES: hypothetical protein [unclassified Variovorax]PNG50319.1 hypothetical protein CHC06_05942 [Variovorax sp. B2]PNG51192.1 hypothetical protein CHC07_05848 [Variovorax sp. B4]VTV17413.1 hypothetical protein WDL1P1_00369 [Variovorax sp. WDL1]
MEADSAASTTKRKHDPRLNNLLLQFAGLVDVGHRWSALSSRLMGNPGICLSQAECTELELLHNRWKAYIHAIAKSPDLSVAQPNDAPNAAKSANTHEGALSPVRPWVGKRYGDESRLGAKVLFLGQSMFSFTGEEPIQEAVILDVERYVLGSERRAYPTKVANIVLNRNGGYLAAECLCEAWQDIAFTNYIQHYVGDDSRLPVERSLQRRSEKAFYEVVEQLRPDLMVVLGARLAEWLPPTPGIERVCIHSPQSSFEYARWNPVVQAALAKVRA